MFELFQDKKQEYDYKRLRKDLENEFAIQSVSFSGGFGFCQMMDASSASSDELLRIAKREGFNLNKYRK